MLEQPRNTAPPVPTPAPMTRVPLLEAGAAESAATRRVHWPVDTSIELMWA